MSRRLDVLVLPAYDALPGLPSEVEPWRRTLELTESIQIDGLDRPIRCTDDGVGLVHTGVGKLSAATTTAAIAASDAVDLDGALIVTAGIAGGPPEAVSIGTVVVSSCIVDWDNKLRFDAPRDGRVRAIEPNPYNPDQSVVDLDPGLVEWARATITGAESSITASASPVTAAIGVDGRSVAVGTNLCGDELFHGGRIAADAEWFVEHLGRSPYLATEMEDIGTAVALERFGHLDRYLSIRSIANFDRSTTGSTAFDDPTGLADGAKAALGTLVPAVSTLSDRELDR